MTAHASPACGYERARSVADACERLRSREGAIPLAGGTDVVPMRAGGTITPELLVDVKGVEELREFRRLDDGSFRLGACVSMAELSAWREPGTEALADGAGVVGGPPTRTRATIGGNVCRSSPAGDTLPGLLVLGASIRLRSTEGQREVPIGSFFTGPGTNMVGPGELLEALVVPARSGGSAYERLTYRAWLDLAVLGVAARIELVDGECTDAAVAIGGVAPTPKLVAEASAALLGSPVAADDIASAAQACVESADPIDDVRGTRPYRIHALEVVAGRVIESARRRASERSSS